MNGENAVDRDGILCCVDVAHQNQSPFDVREYLEWDVDRALTRDRPPVDSATYMAKSQPTVVGVLGGVAGALNREPPRLITALYLNAVSAFLHRGGCFVTALLCEWHPLAPTRELSRLPLPPPPKTIRHDPPHRPAANQALCRSGTLPDE